MASDIDEKRPTRLYDGTYQQLLECGFSPLPQSSETNHRALALKVKWAGRAYLLKTPGTEILVSRAKLSISLLTFAGCRNDGGQFPVFANGTAT